MQTMPIKKSNKNKGKIPRSKKSSLAPSLSQNKIESVTTVNLFDDGIALNSFTQKNYPSSMHGLVGNAYKVEVSYTPTVQTEKHLTPEPVRPAESVLKQIKDEKPQ